MKRAQGVDTFNLRYPKITRKDIFYSHSALYPKEISYVISICNIAATVNPLFNPFSSTITGKLCCNIAAKGNLGRYVVCLSGNAPCLYICQASKIRVIGHVSIGTV